MHSYIASWFIEEEYLYWYMLSSILLIILLFSTRSHIFTILLMLIIQGIFLYYYPGGISVHNQPDNPYQGTISQLLQDIDHYWQHSLQYILWASLLVFIVIDNLFIQRLTNDTKGLPILHSLYMLTMCVAIGNYKWVEWHISPLDGIREAQVAQLLLIGYALFAIFTCRKAAIIVYRLMTAHLLLLILVMRIYNAPLVVLFQLALLILFSTLSTWWQQQVSTGDGADCNKHNSESNSICVEQLLLMARVFAMTFYYACGFNISIGSVDFGGAFTGLSTYVEPLVLSLTVAILLQGQTLCQGYLVLLCLFASKEPLQRGEKQEQRMLHGDKVQPVAYLHQRVEEKQEAIQQVLFHVISWRVMAVVLAALAAFTRRNDITTIWNSFSPKFVFEVFANLGYVFLYLPIMVTVMLLLGCCTSTHLPIKGRKSLDIRKKANH